MYFIQEGIVDIIMGNGEVIFSKSHQFKTVKSCETQFFPWNTSEKKIGNPDLDNLHIIVNCV